MLESSRLNLISFLDDQDKKALTFKVDKDKWSPLQICFHVIKSEQLTFLTLNKNLQLKDNLKKSGFADIIRDASLSFILKSKIKIKAPALVAKPPENYDLPELIKKWETIRTSIKNYLEVFPEKYLKREIFNHPIVGWLNLAQTLNFLQNHLDHHVRQILSRVGEYKNLNSNK